MSVPRKLSNNIRSPHYDPAALRRVYKVFVDDVHLPNCYAYDMDSGWAAQSINGVWKPKVYGVVRVTERQ